MIRGDEMDQGNYWPMILNSTPEKNEMHSEAANICIFRDVKLCVENKSFLFFTENVRMLTSDRETQSKSKEMKFRGWKGKNTLDCLFVRSWFLHNLHSQVESSCYR